MLDALAEAEDRCRRRRAGEVLTSDDDYHDPTDDSVDCATLIDAWLDPIPITEDGLRAMGFTSPYTPQWLASPKFANDNRLCTNLETKLWVLISDDDSDDDSEIYVAITTIGQLRTLIRILK